jgi:arylsulfatase A-like enzyme
VLFALLVLSCSGSKDLPPPPAGGGDSTPADSGPIEAAPVASNLLFVTLDTLRWDVLPRYSEERSWMPFLSGRLDAGITWDNAATCGHWTYTGMFCLTSGQPPLGSPLESGGGGALLPVPEEATLLAEVLGGAGFATAVVTDSPVFNSELGFLQGFDTIVEREGNDGAVIIEEGLAALEGLESPWYLHLHFLDMHTPYANPFDEEPPEGCPDLRAEGEVNAAIDGYPELPGEEQEALTECFWWYYGEQARHLDGLLEGLWGELEARGALADTLVVIATDHGEQFGEHEGITHRLGLHPEEIQGLVSFWYEGVSPESIDAPTSQIDVAPTALALLGVSAPEGSQGVSGGNGEVALSYDCIYLEGEQRRRYAAWDEEHRVVMEETDQEDEYEAFVRASDPLDLEDIDVEDLDVAHLVAEIQAMQAAAADHPYCPGP